MTIFGIARKAWALLGRRSRFGALLVLALSLCVAVVETAAAVSVLDVFRALSSPNRPAASSILPLSVAHVAKSSRLYVLLGFTAGVFVVRGLLWLLQMYIQLRFAYNTSVRFSQRLARKYLSLPYSFHLQRSSPELIRRSLESVHVVSTVVLVGLASIASQLTMAAALFLLLMVRNPATTAVLIVVLLLLLGLLGRLTRKHLSGFGRESLKQYKEALQAFQQSLDLIREIMVLGRRDYFERRFVEARAQYARSGYLSGTLAQVPRAALETTFMVALLSLIGVAHVSGSSSSSTLASLALLSYVALRILPALSAVATYSSQVRVAAPALDDIYAELAVAPDVAGAYGRPTPLRFADAISCEDVSFVYPKTERQALSGIALTIAAGESVAFVGPTGCGKSTLVNILIGLIAPSSGRVTVDGAPLDGQESHWQANVGLVPQDILLIDDTLRHNIALGLRDDEIDAECLNRAIERAQLQNFVSELPDGLETRVGERGVRLSGGQRQRVAIARALYSDPQLVVLDEGTSSLDAQTERDVLSSFDLLKGTHTVIAVAHRLSTVKNCDRIYLLVEGRIVDHGSYGDLLERNATFRTLT